VSEQYIDSIMHGETINVTMAWFIWLSDFIPVKTKHFAGTKSTHINIYF